MAQEKIVEYSNISVVKNSDGSFVSENSSKEVDILSVELLEDYISRNSIQGYEGELILSSYLKSADMVIDINGNLLVLHNDSCEYAVNDMGELLYITK